MIYFNYLESNSFSFQLSDINTATYSYIFSVTNTLSRENIIFHADNYSDSLYFQAFTISCFTYSGLTAGIVNLNPGHYHVDIYETNYPYTLDISQAERIVKSDILIVKGPTVSHTYNTPIQAYKINYPNGQQ